MEKAVAVVDRYYTEGPADGEFVRSLQLLNAAMIMYARRKELSALIMYEAGKSLRELMVMLMMPLIF